MEFLQQCLSCSIGIACLAMFVGGVTMFWLNFGKFPKIALFWNLVAMASLTTALVTVPAQASQFEAPSQKAPVASFMLFDGPESDR